MEDNREIKKSLEAIHSFTEEQLNIFISKLKPKKIDKKEHLLKPSQKCDFMAFINKGSLRFYSVTDTEEPTLHFFTENSWVADYESFISQQGTKNFLQALEETEVQIISLDDIHLLMEQFPVFRNLASLMNKWVITSTHHISISNSSPDERYQKLLQEHPDWINRFPQMYIASYLGMTKETFSRVKSRVR
jgi:CRP/FNR family transcriptional regulator, anaerobic regulatory protein